MLAGCGLAGVVGLLGAVAAGQVLAVRDAQHQVHVAQAQEAALHAEVTSLQTKTSVHTSMEERARTVASALQGEVDWVRVLGQLAAVMPPNVTLNSFSGQHATEASQGSSAASSVGTVTFNVQGTGGLPAAASWLDGLKKDPSFQSAWVTGIATQTNGGKVDFSSTADLTPTADSNRSKEIQP